MIYALIPVFNRLELTKRCIASIKAQSKKERIEIIVVDDGSTDGTSQWLSSSREITVLQGSGSLFWCGAVHYGIEYCLRISKKGDYLLLLNNDVELASNTVELLEEFLSNRKKTAIASAVTVDIRDRDTIIKTGSIVKNWYLNKTYHVYTGTKQSNIDKNLPVCVDFLTARCLLHPIEVFWQAGNYDSRTFKHYGGDDEFSIRVKKFGIETFLIPSATVYMKQELFSKLSFLEVLFSIRSSSNIINKFKLSLVIAPNTAKFSFFLCGILKSLLFALINELRKNSKH